MLQIRCLNLAVEKRIMTVDQSTSLFAVPSGTRTIALTGAVASLVGGIATTGLIMTINGSAMHMGQGSAAQIGQFFALLVLSMVGSMTALVLITKLSQTSVHHIRMSLCRRILNTPLRQLDTIGIAKLFAVLTDDVSSIAMATLAFPTMLANCAVLAGCMIYMCWLAPSWFAITLAVAAVGILSYRWVALYAGRSFEAARETEDLMSEYYRTITSGAKELKLHSSRRAQFINDIIEPTSLMLKERNSNGLAMFALAQTWAQALFFLAIGGVLYGMRMTEASAEHASAYVLTLIYVLMPLGTVVTLLPTLSKAKIALKKIASLGLEPDMVVASPKHVFSGTDWHRLSLRNITFSYDDPSDNFILGPIDLDLQPGEVVFIVGGNGGGKTTFARVITGLYPPSTGEVRLDGVLIEEAERDHYREYFAAIFADFWLFDHLPVSADSKSQALKAAGYLAELELQDKLHIEDGRFSTTALSQGQRKRLALLLAMLDDRPIYLFDEWAADQDPRFRDVFYNELLPKFRQQGKGVIIISHDEHYFSQADRILRLDRGRLIVVDTPSSRADAFCCDDSRCS